MASEHGTISAAGGQVVEYTEALDQTEVQSYEDAEPRGPSDRWQFWSEEIQAALKAEERWREEGREAERAYFGEDDKAYTTEEYRKAEHETNIIHANIEVLKPLLFSENPTPIVRRRFGGDGENDPTDRVAAVVAERLAQYLVDTTAFEDAMEAARDDWLVPGRGSVRVMYSANFKTQPVTDPATGLPIVDTLTGQPFQQEVKASERIRVRRWPWSRILFSATNGWEENRWTAWETPMSQKQAEKRFGPEKAQAMRYPLDGLKGAAKSESTTGSSRDMEGWKADTDSETSGTPSVSAHAQCTIYEIWDKETRRVIWWSPDYRDDVLDEIEDPLGLEDFWNCPKPLLAAAKNGSLTPRPDIAFYQARAREIDVATRKLSSILDAISVSGLYPGRLVEEIKSLLKGDRNRMIPVEEWVALMEKGGTDGIIQWLPLEQFLKAAQALVSLRDQAKQAMYEISGISDIVRGATDPNETATSQQIKGSYANIRLKSRQRQMHRFARDTIRIMLEIAVEHFDTKTIARIVNLDLPETDADLQRALAMLDQQKQQHAMVVTAAQAQGVPPPPPPPEPPFFERTSWEAVHATLRDDLTRKFALQIETDGTILTDQEEDKKARVEFLQAFAALSERLIPMAASGVVPMKVVKELLLFAVRGFPKSRTLEGMLSGLPDKPQDNGPSEDPTVTAAKIRAQVDLEIAKLRASIDLKKIDASAEEAKADRQHDGTVKAAGILAGAAKDATRG